MPLDERRDRYPHGELIVPDGHIVLRSIYQFKDSTEVYAFLHGCKKKNCSVCFQNEYICVDRDGIMNVPEIAISVYMHMKENPKMVESYLSFLVKAGSREWAIDRVEVIE
jgi:hypothetical protein